MTSEEAGLEGVTGAVTFRMGRDMFKRSELGRRTRGRDLGRNRSRIEECAADRRWRGPRKREGVTHLSIWLVSHIGEKPVLDLLVEVRDLIKSAFGRGGLCDFEFEDAGLIADAGVVIPGGASAIAQIRVCLV
jgi:hypothetical protein